MTRFLQDRWRRDRPSRALWGCGELEVLDGGRRCEERTDDGAELAKAWRLPKVDEMRVQMRPADLEAVGAARFDAAEELMRNVAGRARHDGGGAWKCGLERVHGLRTDREGGDF